MKLHGGETLTFTMGGTVESYKISAVNGGIVKMFGHNGEYRHMPYKNLMEMIEKGYVTVENESDMGQLL